MAVHLVIDGYNLIGASLGLTGRAGPGRPSMEEERRALVERLALYRRKRPGLRITVVFDAGRAGGLSRSRRMDSGIEVLFSRGGEEADEVIAEMARAAGASLTVVSSDREVARSARSAGSVVLGSGEFHALLEEALYGGSEGLEPGDDDDGDLEKGPSTRKKGPSRRLPRHLRSKKRRLKKL